MSNVSRAKAIELILFNLNDLVNPLIWYEATDSLEASCFYIRFTNTGPNYILVSYDRGTNAHDVIPPAATTEVYFQANASYSEKTNNMAKGMSIYLLGTQSNHYFYITGYTYTE